MANSTLASGGAAAIAGAIVIVLHHILSYWNITIPPDVDTALTVIIYFLGHMIVNARMVQPPPAAADTPKPPTPAA